MTEREISEQKPLRMQFDRGTIVLDAVPPLFDAQRLPGVLWDPRVGRFRAPASAYAELRAALDDAGLPFEDRVAAPFAGLDDWTAPALRSYQEAALSAWDAAGRRGVIALPTGSGKTRVAIAAVARAGCAALCLVPTRVLLDQWCRELSACYGGPVGRLGDGARAPAAVTVTTYASAERWMPHLGNRFPLVVVDEAHHAGGAAFEDVLAMSIARHRLGLTATPPRDGPARDRLERLIGPVVYELCVGDLAGRFLAPFDLVSITVELSSAERRAYETEMGVFRPAYVQFCRSAPEATWVDFVRAASCTEEGRRAVAAWRRARRVLGYPEAKRALLGELLTRHADARVLVFTADNESAYAIAGDHLVMPITCHIGRRERQAALERFRTGELRALVSARVLNEGVDVPDADVAIVVGGSHGEREHVQRIGRLLRPVAGKRALVYELVARRTSEVRQARQRRSSLAPRVAAQL